MDTARQDTLQCLLCVLEIDKVTRYSSETGSFHVPNRDNDAGGGDGRDCGGDRHHCGGEWSVVEGTSVSGLG